MERTDGPKTAYEVYCYNCHTSFALGTKTCVHCGHRIAKVQPGPGGGPIPDLVHPDEEEEAGESLGKRLASMAVWVLIVLGAALTRLCNGD
jgi:hypothetical protein